MSNQPKSATHLFFFIAVLLCLHSYHINQLKRRKQSLTTKRTGSRSPKAPSRDLSEIQLIAAPIPAIQVRHSTRSHPMSAKTGTAICFRENKNLQSRSTVRSGVGNIDPDSISVHPHCNINNLTTIKRPRRGLVTVKLHNPWNNQEYIQAPRHQLCNSQTIGLPPFLSLKNNLTTSKRPRRGLVAASLYNPRNNQEYIQEPRHQLCNNQTIGLHPFHSLEAAAIRPSCEPNKTIIKTRQFLHNTATRIIIPRQFRDCRADVIDRRTLIAISKKMSVTAETSSGIYTGGGGNAEGRPNEGMTRAELTEKLRGVMGQFSSPGTVRLRGYIPRNTNDEKCRTLDNLFKWFDAFAKAHNLATRLQPSKKLIRSRITPVGVTLAINIITVLKVNSIDLKNDARALFELLPFPCSNLDEDGKLGMFNEIRILANSLRLI